MKTLNALLILALGIALSACAHKKSADDVCNETIPASDGRPTILVIGDSISIGWMNQVIANDSLPNYQVVHNPCNAKFSTYTLENIDGWLSARPQFYAIVWNNGLWDIASWVNTSGSDYQLNEAEIAHKIMAKTSRPLFLLTTGVPVNTPYRNDANVAAYNALAVQVINTELGLPVLDLYTASHSAPIVNEHVDPVQQDDVHYTTQGYNDIAALVLNELNALYGIQ